MKQGICGQNQKGHTISRKETTPKLQRLSEERANNSICKREKETEAKDKSLASCRGWEKYVSALKM